MRIVAVIVTIGFLTIGCADQQLKQKNAELIAKVDSLEQTIEENEYIVSLLATVSQYLDSIDSHRKEFSINLERGVTEEDYIERMKGLNQYVQKAEWTISELEKNKNTYASQIKHLKNEMNEKNNRITQMQLSVDHKNADMRLLQIKLVRKQHDLMEKEASMDFVKKELNVANDEIIGLMTKARLNEAEIYYAQGEGMEEVAKTIRFASKKKNRTLENALQAYTISYEMGYTPAADKVVTLREKIKQDE